MCLATDPCDFASFADATQMKAPPGRRQARARVLNDSPIRGRRRRAPMLRRGDGRRQGGDASLACEEAPRPTVAGVTTTSPLRAAGHRHASAVAYRSRWRGASIPGRLVLCSVKHIARAYPSAPATRSHVSLGGPSPQILKKPLTLGYRTGCARLRAFWRWF